MVYNKVTFAPFHSNKHTFENPVGVFVIPISISRGLSSLSMGTAQGNCLPEVSAVGTEEQRPLHETDHLPSFHQMGERGAHTGQRGLYCKSYSFWSPPCGRDTAAVTPNVSEPPISVRHCCGCPEWMSLSSLTIASEVVLSL